MRIESKARSHKNLILKGAIALSLFLSVINPSRAAIIFQDDDFAAVESGGIILNFLDQYVGDITIQFGSSLGETIAWSAANNRFEISDDLDLTNNQLTTARIENIAALPGGGGGLGAGGIGRIVQLTATDSTAPGCTTSPNCPPGSYTWDGSTWS